MGGTRVRDAGSGRHAGILGAGVLAAIAALALVLQGCATQQRTRLLDETLREYNSLIRWNEFVAAADYYDPELRRSRPITQLELNRLAQVRVSGYDQRAVNTSPDGRRVTQVVQIRLYNVHTLAERTIVDRQVWRYDPEAERWWLTTGLPDVTAGRDQAIRQGTPQ